MATTENPYTRRLALLSLYEGGFYKELPAIVREGVGGDGIDYLDMLLVAPDVGDEVKKDAELSKSVVSFVMKIQVALSRQENGGHYKGSIDGIYGKGTREAIRDFQEENDIAQPSDALPELIVVGRDSLDALGIDPDIFTLEVCAVSSIC